MCEDLTSKGKCFSPSIPFVAQCQYVYCFTVVYAEENKLEPFEGENVETQHAAFFEGRMVQGWRTPYPTAT